MPSQRRLKATLLLTFAALLTLLYMTHGATQTRTSEFYTRTVAAIDARQRAAGLAAEQEALLESQQRRKPSIKNPNEDPHRLKMKEVPVPEKKVDSSPPSVGQLPSEDTFADAGMGIDAKIKGSSGNSEKAGQEPLVEGAGGPVLDPIDGDSVTGAAAAAASAVAEKSVAGRKMMKDKDAVAAVAAAVPGKNKDDGVAKVGNTGVDQVKKVNGAEDDGEVLGETEEEHQVEVELGGILKKSPIIIFSKSYCPHSKKAKHILLDLYHIVPEPYVAELDLHPLGPQLQAALMKSTGRRTVPNVLISGKSIGGGDEVAALDHDGKLIETIKSMGKKRIMQATKVDL